MIRRTLLSAALLTSGTCAPTVHRAAPVAARTTTTRVSRGVARTTTTVNIGTALSVAKASWYAQGTRTASGERFDPDGLTFAHRTMAFGTRVQFCRTGRCVVATCTDRGPAASTGREFDLSRGAFSAIAPLSAGVVAVEWEAQ